MEAYQKKEQKDTRLNLTLCSKVFKTAEVVKELNHLQKIEFNQKVGEISQLSQENLLLRNLLNLRKETEEETEDSLMRESENIIEEGKKPKREDESQPQPSLYGDSEFNPFNKKKVMKPSKVGGIMSSKEMLKKEIKNRNKNFRRSRATSFHFGSETPTSTDNDFEEFD